MIKRIFLPYSGTAEELDAVRLAIRLAEKLDAHIDALFVAHSADALQGMDREVFDLIKEKEGYEAGAAYLENAYRQRYGPRAAEARRAVEQIAASASASDKLTWCENSDVFGPSQQLFREHAYTHDLVVASHHLSPVLHRRLIGDAIFTTGRPVLLVPRLDGEIDDLTAVVAWKPMAPTVHAVTAALPLIQIASRCLVVSIQEGEEAQEPDAIAFAEHLSAQDVKVDAQTLPASGEKAEIVLSRFMTNTGANLLVMGAYSQSRFRQLIFGGFTRYFLTSKEHLVLLAH